MKLKQCIVCLLSNHDNNNIIQALNKLPLDLSPDRYSTINDEAVKMNYEKVNSVPINPKSYNDRLFVMTMLQYKVNYLSSIFYSCAFANNLTMINRRNQMNINMMVTV